MIDYLQNTIFWGNPLINYVYFIGMVIASFIGARFIEFVFQHFVLKLAKKTKTQVDDIIAEAFHKPLRYAIFFIGIYISLEYIYISDAVNNVLAKIITAITIVLIIWGLTKLVHSLLDIYWLPRAKSSKSNVDNNLIPIVKSLASWIIWIIGIIFILSNLGLNVSSLVAGLGIGGLAIAFALQGVFADLFASISIYLDRPFHVGDYVVVGTDSGTVKKIGLKSTRITTLQGEELVVSNKELTEARVRNYKKMKKRRIAFRFGVEYGTSPTKLKKIPQIVKTIVNSVKHAEFDRAHFFEFGDSSLNFEVVMYIDTREYVTYMDVQQNVNLKITEAFAKEKISMAFPTHTIHLKK